ncbi:MHS family MFS transporter [Pseudonocardia ailaonensis]|uniref:MHS family MFS transporter n=1 Tax=Pseudonocardia ailaonensis TaxID=367279 RepID=A0ABN2MKW6_9PSEU
MTRQQASGTSADAPPLPAHSPEQAVRMRRVALASTVGTVVEFYDFFIFSTAAVLVFQKVFYAQLGGAAATASALATIGVAFVARPFGAILFGHFGDRVGRKKTLVTSMLLMGVATVCVGLAPTAATLGVAAPLLLVALRIAQGLAVGGEWAGALLMATEYAPPGKRGTFAMFPQLGPSLGLALSTATFLVTSLVMDDASFLSWGWRIPFLLSAVLVGVGLWVRLSLEETPVFRTQARRSRAPFLDLVRTQPRELALASGATVGVLAFFGTSATMLLNYGSNNLGLPRTPVLLAAIAGGVCFAVFTILGGLWSDRVGRRPLLLGSHVLAVASGLVLFPILDLATVPAFTIGLLLAFAVTGLGYAPLGAQLAEVFATRYRYTGSGLAYNIGGVVGAASAPLIGAVLLEHWGSLAVGGMLAVYAAVALLCLRRLGETGNRSLHTS